MTEPMRRTVILAREMYAREYEVSFVEASFRKVFGRKTSTIMSLDGDHMDPSSEKLEDRGFVESEIVGVPLSDVEWERWVSRLSKVTNK